VHTKKTSEDEAKLKTDLERGEKMRKKSIRGKGNKTHENGKWVLSGGGDGRLRCGIHLLHTP